MSIALILRTKAMGLSAALAGILFLSSCEYDSTFRGFEFMPNMYRGPAVETYSGLDLYADSASARKPVKGTISRGFMEYQSFNPGPTGYDSAKANLSMPEDFPTGEKTLAEGKELYNIFCAACHGAKGAGNGMLVKNEKILGVPNYADRDINEGTIFHVVTYGKGIMGSHASQVTPEERWKLSQYVLQLRSELVKNK